MSFSVTLKPPWARQCIYKFALDFPAAVRGSKLPLIIPRTLVLLLDQAVQKEVIGWFYIIKCSLLFS